MIYKQKAPKEVLSEIIKSFWMIDGENDTTIREEKIIPDGYPEMIFHYGDSFQSMFSSEWMIQEKDLLAGQIRNYFLLKNTGKVGMFALKFQPWALRKYFGIKIADFTDKVLPINFSHFPVLAAIRGCAISTFSFEEKISAIENILLEALDLSIPPLNGEQAARLILQERGAIHLQDLCQHGGISERSLERYFKEYIGLPPKFYCRVIRFSNIFSLVNQGTVNWSDVSFYSGFYDQSHFIKNFKEFTGEEPSNYGFTEKNMANFFLTK